MDYYSPSQRRVFFEEEKGPRWSCLICQISFLNHDKFSKAPVWTPTLLWGKEDTESLLILQLLKYEMFCALSRRCIQLMIFYFFSGIEWGFVWTTEVADWTYLDGVFIKRKHLKSNQKSRNLSMWSWWKKFSLEIMINNIWNH